MWSERGRIDNKAAGGAASEKKKQGATKKIAARTKSGGREIEAISLEEELGEFHLFGAVVMELWMRRWVILQGLRRWRTIYL